MTETTSLGLPLVQPAQAQKHVTVNEALARLDGLVQLRIASATTAVPPAVEEGAVYAIPAGATGGWSGRAGQLALGQSGGWVFVTPEAGWQGWLLDSNRPVRFDGSSWGSVPVTASGSGAGLRFETISFDHTLGSGASSTTGTAIPANSMVFAVSARVVTSLSGSLLSWRLGDGAQNDRYGNGMGVGVGSYAQGILGSPMTVYSDTPLVVTANGGTFAGGLIRIAAHVARIDLPEI